MLSPERIKDMRNSLYVAFCAAADKKGKGGPEQQYLTMATAAREILHLDARLPGDPLEDRIIQYMETTLDRNFTAMDKAMGKNHAQGYTSYENTVAMAQTAAALLELDQRMRPRPKGVPGANVIRLRR